MSEFLVLLPSSGSRADIQAGLQAGIRLAQQSKNLTPNCKIEDDWFSAATFPRSNNSGTPVIKDPGSGDWLLTTGTWFHQQGLGSGDEERLLKILGKVGADKVADELEGFFVIVYGKAKTKEVFVITDIIGSCHCYQRDTVFGTALSSSPLILAGLGDVTLDDEGIQEFLYTGVMYEDRTFYREIRKMAPCSVHHFPVGKSACVKRYWNFENIQPGSLDDGSAARQLGSAITQAAVRIGAVFSNPVCDLTGGYDSRATIVGFLAADVPFATAVSGTDADPDVRISKGLAKIINKKHIQSKPIGLLGFEQLKEALPYTDGEYELAEYYRILNTHRNLSKNYDISINGSFGEVGRGYWWELLIPVMGKTNKLDVEKIARLRYATSPHDSSIFKKERRLDLVSHFSGIIERTNQSVADLPNTAQMDHAYLMMRMQCWQGRIASSTNHLWPCLSPFMFRSVLETMLASSVRMRKNGLLIRKMLVELHPEVAGFPLEHGYPAIPFSIGNAHRFLPLLGHYKDRVVGKLARKLGYGAKKKSGGLNQRLRLWQEEDVRRCLNVDEMLLSSVADKDKLKTFIEKSRQDAFSYDDQFLRLLTVEYTLSVLRDSGVKFA